MIAKPIIENAVIQIVKELIIMLISTDFEFLVTGSIIKGNSRNDTVKNLKVRIITSVDMQ